MIIAVDTGGTKTLVARFSSQGAIEATMKFPTPQNENEFLQTLQATVTDIADSKSITTLSVGFPGVIKNSIVEWCGNLSWTNFAIKERLAEHFIGTNILVENDANLGGLAETRVLSPVPTSSLYVTISTGIGTGIITNGGIDPGMRLSEGGHIMVEFDGMVQLWERFASGKAIHDTYGMYARDITSRKIWHDIADRISRGLLVIIPLLQPDIIIIGGSMGTYYHQYRSELGMIIQEKLPAHIPSPKIAAAQHPEEAVIYGCYYHAIDQKSVQ